MPLQNAAFSKSEYDRRIAKTRAAMEAEGIDVLFATDPSNQAWLTGYDGWSFYVHQGAILDHGTYPIWWGRMQDTAGARRTVWMEEDRIAGYSEHLVQNPHEHPMEDLAKRLIDMGHGSARIGIEMDNYYYSAKAHAVLNEHMPNANFVDATALVNWQRAEKSNEEIAFIRKAASISEKIVRFALEKAEPGIRKNELVGDIVQSAFYGTKEAWGDYPAIVPLTPSGADATAPHLTWNGDVLKHGEGTFFELSGCYRRYHAPLCRTVFLGKPDQKMVDASKALASGISAGIDAARRGNTTGDVARALNAELVKSGIHREGRCGYPIGLSYPPDWGERTYSIRPTDTTELRPGMTFHFMPGLWMDDWGLETTETLLIKDSGAAEALCNIERKLFVKP